MQQHQQQIIWLIGLASVLVAQPSWAELSQHELSRHTHNFKDWITQIEAENGVQLAQLPGDPLQVTRVSLNPTPTGLEISLETSDGKPLQIDRTKFRTEGNNLIADIPNAVLVLPTQEFKAENPAADIVSVQVVQQDSTNIQVRVLGNNMLPKTNITLKTGELTYSLNPTVQQSDPDVEILVTADRAQGYRVPNTTTGSRTDTPLRDLPFSVQVVPQELLEDRRIESVNEALRTVAGVTPDNPSYSAFEGFTIRGFTGRNIIRNGLRDDTNITSRIAIPNIEQVEVLRGPAGALFSQGGPGGTVNIVTKKPLSTRRYHVEGTIGSFDTYGVSLDFTGPINDSKTLLYRFIAGASTTGTFIDYFDRRNYVIAPSLTWNISPTTRINFEGEYTIGQQPNARGLPARGTVLPNINGKLPRNRFIGEPDDELDKNDRYALRLGYTLEHKFSDNWQLRNAFRATLTRSPQNSLFPSNLLDDQRTLERGLFSTEDQSQDNYIIDTNVVGTFKTGSIAHKLLFGIDLNRDVYASSSREFQLDPIDIFNPVYRQSRRIFVAEYPREPYISDSLGIYVQNQIDLLPNLKILLGGRFDIVSQKIDFADNTESFQQDEAFSPRVGLVYQPIESVSLYASYSRSFLQNVGTAFDNRLFQPERGTQYEVGVKADWLDRRLSTTLALYQINRTNVLTTDPANPNFSIQTGEQRSRGIELDIAGEILPGWKIAAGYAYTDAKITADNTYTVGNRINNVPEHAVSLWTTYEIQSGSVRGLGFGLGIFYVGEREGDLDNSFQVPGYTRVDASVFYRRDNFRIGLNIENLFDVSYFETAESTLRVYYGAPITIKGTISWTF
ncbi:ferrichrome-iron receptor [[Phormidium ambiguum] IAM M-71]|uniref:Ferrichrome-iron receptor n=1 Tax=[Phormidium ambiguum] IAM M-71 TaxID=454136 RepID=A0A1U7IKV7_9CYAN|nr:TonB-dependent siderophore receptor [Phormidium ambiguum]OKH37857.1 ferrichrome-iron receptor [Phormidium ambiguum IAM M-71]